MASNSFGTLFSFTTFGESHGPAIGVVVDGCPAGVPLDEEHINKALAKRSPGQNAYTSPRKEKDLGRILSGVFEGTTTGAPIAIIIENNDADSSKYAALANMLRPGHANMTYLDKYGIYDYRGGGRASARETAARVAAGAVASAMLAPLGINIFAFLQQVGTAIADVDTSDNGLIAVKSYRSESKLFAPNATAEEAFAQTILTTKKNKDSVGGCIQFHIENPPAGLGAPVFAKVPAILAFALMSIPATKGFSLGAGFKAASAYGSTFNDSFVSTPDGARLATNNAGGTLGGISTGNTIYGTVAFKPTPSIDIEQPTLNLEGEPVTYVLPKGSRHDPCVAVRAVPVVEAMCWLTIADLYLAHRSSRI